MKNWEENTIVEREEEMTKPPKLVMAEVKFAKTYKLQIIIL